MNITSSAFENGGAIPSLYTADGKDISPPLAFEDVPGDAASLALVVDDPDAPAGVWDHWLLWNIPSDTGAVGEGKTPDGVAGKNDFGTLEYGGPAPPAGTHTYRFTLYALDAKPDLPAGSDRSALEAAMEGHVLDSAVLKGTYSR